jgi:DNA-binding NarL/FixJ family response regulator
VDQNTTRIFIADDHPLVRGALRQAVLGAVAQADVVECGDLDALSAELPNFNPTNSLEVIESIWE